MSQARVGTVDGLSDTSAILAFAYARLAEEEAAARAASPTFAKFGFEHWYWNDRCPCGGLAVDPLVSWHITRQDPASVMRRVEACREILRSCEFFLSDMTGSPPEACALADSVIRDMASAFKDHPDWRVKWE